MGIFCFFRPSVISIVLLMVIAIPVNATVTTNGDVDPGGADTQPNTWFVTGELYVGKPGRFGTLNVVTGGQVSNTAGHLGYQSTSTGVATITGVGSRWNNSGNMFVGRERNGTVDIIDFGLLAGAFGEPSRGLFDRSIDCRTTKYAATAAAIPIRSVSSSTPTR